MFAEEDGRRLAAVRIGLCGLLALHLATTGFQRVASQPAALYQPIWYLNVLQRMPSHGVTTALEICGVLTAIAAAAGLASRASLAVAVSCSLVLDGMINSTGRVIVGNALLILCLLVLLASGRAASDAWSVRSLLQAARSRSVGGSGSAGLEGRRPSPRYGWPIRTAMITIALAFFFAGIQKLRYSGLAWATGENLRWILYASSDRSPHPNAMALFVADRPRLAHLCAAAVLSLEICFPLALVVKKLRWPLVAGAVVMHEAIRLLMGLDYSVQGLTILVVFVDWPVVVGVLRAPARERRTVHRPPTLRAPSFPPGTA